MKASEDTCLAGQVKATKVLNAFLLSILKQRVNALKIKVKVPKHKIIILLM